MRTLAPAAVQAAAGLTLDERLALSVLAMDARLDRASVAISVNTAHIEVEAPEILAAPTTAATQRPVTVTDVLREAARLIRERGWMCRWLTDGVAMCTKGAIQAAAGGDGRLADEAETLLLDRIRAEQPGILSIGAWNDAQTGSAPVIRMLGM